MGLDAPLEWGVYQEEPPPHAGDGQVSPEFIGYSREMDERLFKRAFRLVGNRHAAEDLVQDAWLKAIENRSNLVSPGSQVGESPAGDYTSPKDFQGSSNGPLAPWLMTVLGRSAVDYLRFRARRKGFISMERINPSNPYEPGIEQQRETSPDYGINLALLGQKINWVLDSLKGPTRNVFEMTLAGKTPREIAAETSIPSGHVRYHLFRARGHFRKHYPELKQELLYG